MDSDGDDSGAESPRLPVQTGVDAHAANCRLSLPDPSCTTATAEDAAEALPGPRAPFSSPVRRAPFTAFSRLREARLARQRLMSPLPVLRAPRARAPTPVNASDSSSGVVCKRSTEGEFAAAQASLLLGLWKLTTEDDGPEPAPRSTPVEPDDATDL